MYTTPLCNHSSTPPPLHTSWHKKRLMHIPSEFYSYLASFLLFVTLFFFFLSEKSFVNFPCNRWVLSKLCETLFRFNFPCIFILISDSTHSVNFGVCVCVSLCDSRVPWMCTRYLICWIEGQKIETKCENDSNWDRGGAAGIRVREQKPASTGEKR